MNDNADFPVDDQDNSGSVTEDTESGEALIDEEELLGVVEALIFAAEESLSADRICDIIVDTTGDRPTVAMVDGAVDWLNALYEKGQRSFRIRNWAGGYRMATTPDYAAFVKAMYFQHRETKLSRSLLETLAILAYKQPTTKPEVDHIRGVDSDYALRRLMELGFIEIGGRSEGVGKPLLYRTTEMFMDKFGLSQLDDLPTLREMEELLNDPSFSSQKAQLLMKQGLDLPIDDESTPTHTVAADEISVMPPSDILPDATDTSFGDGAPNGTQSDLSDFEKGSDSNGS